MGRGYADDTCNKNRLKNIKEGCLACVTCPNDNNVLNWCSHTRATRVTGILLALTLHGLLSSRTGTSSELSQDFPAEQRSLFKPAQACGQRFSTTKLFNRACSSRPLQGCQSWPQVCISNCHAGHRSAGHIYPRHLSREGCHAQRAYR